MPTLNIGGTRVKVGDEFLALPPDQQAEAVEEIAAGLGLQGTSDEGADLPDSEGLELTPGRAAGLTARAGVQAAPGAVLGLPALANDAVQQAGNWLYQGVDALAGTDLAERHRRGWGGPLGTVKNLGKVGEMGADALGLPKPETPEERVTVGAGQTALEALGGAGIAKLGAKAAQHGPQLVTRALDELGSGPGVQTAVGGLAGGGAQIAAENDVNPLVGVAGGLGAGIGATVAAAGARQGVRSGTRAIDRALARGEDVQQELARERIRSAASDPNAALRALEDGAGAELVPGSRPTVFQATGDMGLGALERELQTANPGAFADRRASQNAARVESLRGVQGEGEAGELVTFLRRQLDEIDAVTQRFETTARGRAEEAAESIRPRDSAEGIGRTIRGTMSDAEQAARQRESALWRAVDPDGTLTVPTLGVRQAVNGIYSQMSQSARLGVSQAERQFAERVQSFGNVESFKDLQDLSSLVKAQARTELRTAGRTPAYARLTQLSQALRGALENGAAARIMAGDPAVVTRLQAFVDEWRSTQPGSSVGSRARATAGSVRPGGLPSGDGTSLPAARGPGSPARGTRVQGQASARPLPPLSRYIARHGGIALDGEAAARDWGSWTIRGVGRVARPSGRSIDAWRNELIDAGYLPRDADGYSSRDVSREVFRMLEEERAGRRPTAYVDEVQAGGATRELDGPDEELANHASAIRRTLQQNGINEREISTRALNDAAEALARGDEQDAITAYERAVMNLDDEGPVRASYPVNDRPSAGSALDGFRDDPDAGRRYRAATAATRERVGTFGKGYAGAILRQGDDRQSFRMADASVAANVFRPGPTGGERIKAAVKAGAKPSDLAEIAALSLNKAAMRADGTVDPAKFNRWRTLHADALREMPEDARARFANASLASQALDRIAAARKAKLDAFNKSVLGQVAKVDVEDLPRTIGAILNSRDSAAKMGKLAAAARKDEAAREGLRRAVAEYVESRFISNKEVGASGANGIRADAFASFIKDKAPALKAVFGADALARFQAIADDIKRAERSLQAVRVPGNSNSPADLGSVLDRVSRATGKQSLLSQIMIAAGGGALVGDFTGAAAGALGALGKHTLGAMRAAGLKRVDDLVLEMMLDPRLARAALVKAPLDSKGAQQVLGAVLRRIAPLTVVAGQAAGQGQ